MSKLIVTHSSPDFDGIPAIWLFKKFHPDYADAQVAFVPAGTTYKNEPVDVNPDIVHVDTGLGRFDHHQTSDFTCGAQLVYEFLVKEGYIAKDDLAMARLIRILTEMDHGYDNYRWPDLANDRNEFFVHNVLVGFKMTNPKQDEKYVEWVSNCMDAIYKLLQNKVHAEGEIERGIKFKTRWGEGIGVESVNDAVLDVGIKGGFALVVRKDPSRGFLRVTGSNDHQVDLTRAYEAFCKKDPEATWFLHASKVLLRNGSARNPTMKATKLTIKEAVEILEKA